jgi:transposase-like protein
MDAVHYKIKEEGRYVGKAIYTLLGLTVDGEKEILGLYLSASESASYY